MPIHPGEQSIIDQEFNSLLTALSILRRAIK
jgi:hypothetical protein